MPTPTKGPRLGGSPAHERLHAGEPRHVAVRARPDHHHRGQGQAAAPAGRAADHLRQAWRHPRPPQVLTRDPRQGRGAHAVRRDRSALREPAGWLHPDHQARPAQGRQRPDGGRSSWSRPSPSAQTGGRRGRARPRHPFRARRQPTGATAEAAAELAGESPTAAAVAAEAAVPTEGDTDGAPDGDRRRARSRCRPRVATPRS